MANETQPWWNEKLTQAMELLTDLDCDKENYPWLKSLLDGLIFQHGADTVLRAFIDAMRSCAEECGDPDEEPAATDLEVADKLGAIWTSYYGGM
jgi:hypothetical protein